MIEHLATSQLTPLLPQPTPRPLPTISSLRLRALASSVVKHQTISYVSPSVTVPWPVWPQRPIKEPPHYLLSGRGPEANEEGKATLTDIIIPVWLAPARRPFCGLITVFSFTHGCGCHYFTHLRHPYVFPRLYHSNCVSSPDISVLLLNTDSKCSHGFSRRQI